MTLSEYRKLKLMIDEATSETEDPEERKEAIKSILSEAGIFYSEWVEFENMVSESVDTKEIKFKEEIKGELENITNSLVEKLSEIENRVKNIKPSVINKIVKEVVKEKPQVFFTSKIIKEITKEVDSSVKDDLGKLKKELSSLEENTKKIRNELNKIPEPKDWTEKIKDLSWQVDNISNKRTISHGYGDMGSFNEAILDNRYYKKDEVDALIAVENLFNRTGTTLSPYNANDNLDLGSGNILTTGSLGITGSRLTKGWFADLEVTNLIVGGITGNSATATKLLNARTIGGVSFDGTGNITVVSATGGFTISGGDLGVSAAGSDTTTPRVFGLTNMTSGTAVRFQFGDEHNGFQNGYALDTTIYAYWGIVLCGGMQNYSSGFLPPTFTKTTDTGVLILSTNDVGDDPGAGATNIVTLGIQACSGQTNDLTQWRNSSDTTLALVTSMGNMGIGDTTFGANAVSVLAIANGTAPAAHVDNEIQMYSVDSSDNTATLGFMLEQAVEDVGTFTASHKIKIKINGTEYWLQLDAV